MASTKTHPKTVWDTLHNNGPFPLKTLYVTELAGQGNIPSKIDRYNDAAVEIQRLIQETHQQNQGFRAFGSAWSMSNIAHHSDRMHYNGFMNISLALSDEPPHPNTSYNSSNLFFFQCGNVIKRISEVLAAHGKSLKTSGASNGQTIAGCISTGVHGSALDTGSVQDYIVGLNLITGPEPEDIYYLERHSSPAMSDQFASKLNAKVLRNDGLFNAALVGLGGFGFIHGVVLEAEDRFLLQRYVRKIDKSIALQLAASLDFANSDFVIPEETDSQGKGNRPYHYKIFINPYQQTQDYMVELIFKKPYTEPYADPLPLIRTSLYRDLIHLLIKISENFPKSIPWFIKRLEKAILPEVREHVKGTLSEIFWDAPYQGPAFACSFGVDHTDAPRALELLVKLTREEGPVPGIFAMRFVKKSEATLSFAKFPVTCMLEIDGVLWKKTNSIMSLTEYSRRMIEVLQANNIAFTLHWGKNADWEFPGLIEHMYGSAVPLWKNYRNSLLSKEMAVLFSNDFLQITGLSVPESIIPDNLIVSL